MKKTKDPFAKFGAICCDCESGVIDETCKDLNPPHFRVFNANSKIHFDFKGDDKFEMDAFVKFVLEKLEYTDPQAKEEL